MHIGVGENNPFAAATLEGLLHRVRLAEPAGRQGIDSHVPQAGIFLRGCFENFRRAVLRAVVSRDHLIPRVIQSEKCLQSAGKLFLLVASGKKDRYRRAIRIVERCDASKGGNFSGASRHINCAENPEKSGGERKGQRERMQRPISSTARCVNTLCYHARCPARFTHIVAQITTRTMSRTISIVGAGRVGQTVARRLHKLGWRIGAVVTRSRRSARAAVRAISAGTPHAALTLEALDADVILLSVPDDVLESVAQKLAKIGGLGLPNRGFLKKSRGKIVLHTSG